MENSEKNALQTAVLCNLMERVTKLEMGKCNKNNARTKTKKYKNNSGKHYRRTKTKKYKNNGY